MRKADFLTMLNALSGFLSIYHILLANYNAACIFMLLSVVFDYMDGFVAKKGKPTALGKQLDSLSDIISFGVAPALFCIVFLVESEYPLLSLLPGLLILAGIYRLARYNITDQSKKFIGMPITMNGLIVPFLHFTHMTNYLIIFVYIILSSCLMVSRIRIKRR